MLSRIVSTFCTGIFVCTLTLGSLPAADPDPGAATAATPAPVVESYRLVNGDELGITVVDEPDQDETLRIDQRGLINQKYLGETKVAGLSVREAEKFLEKQLVDQKYLRHPVVRIRIVTYAVRAVSVSGFVTTPGNVVFQPEVASMDIVDVLARCGWFAPGAKQDKVQVIRRSDSGEDQTFTVNVRSMVSRKGNERFMCLPGDIIRVDDKII